MPTITDYAIAYVNNGFSVIPVNDKKQPIINNWGRFIVEPMDEKSVLKNFKNAYGIGLLMGTPKNLTAIDIDIKYDISNNLWVELKKAIGFDILSKMVCNQTQSGGYHMIFSCNKQEGNLKLANRATTKEEKLETLFNCLKDESSDIDIALRSALSDNSRVLIETRGSGGYVIIPPTPGYSHIYGKLGVITEEEYDFMMDICRSFNTFTPPVNSYKPYQGSNLQELIKKFKESFDVISFLESYGWKVVGRDAKGKYQLRRPGNVHSKHSAYFDPETKLFWVFSTSTSFDVNRTYNPFDLFVELECGGLKQEGAFVEAINKIKKNKYIE